MYPNAELLLSSQQTIEVEEELIDYPKIRNTYGVIRRSLLLEQLILKGQDYSNEELVYFFREWRDKAEYYVLQGQAEHYQMDLNGDLQIKLNDVFRFCKCAKRGNDVYQYLINKKLSKLKKLPNKTYFKNGSAEKKTPALFITLTYDPKLFSLPHSWSRVGKDWNLFLSKIKQRYGKLEFIRAWESHKSGYPHIHATIIFKDHKFSCFERRDKKGNIKFRVPDKDNEYFHKIWHSTVVDVEGIQSLHDGVKETIKYVTKTFNNTKGDLTQTMCWLFNKQGYSVSRGFAEVCGVGGEDLNEPGPADLLLRLKYNSNIDHKFRWIFIGILPGSMLKLSSEVWNCDIKKPPPQLVTVLLDEWRRWRNKF